MDEKVIIAGFGGQGIMLAGKLLVQAGLCLGRHVTFIPSYGAEVRGGTAHCHVIVSDEEIASPIITVPDAAIVMNSPSLAKFSGLVRSGGTVYVNSSIAGEKIERNDIRAVYVPANHLAEELGSVKVANVVTLGAYLRSSRFLTPAALAAALKILLPSRHRDLMTINLAALKKGYEFVEKEEQGKPG
jgi:2-oxoglutarate ferredoxin oxidoreductase subunit gamma